jgi:general secretion pathway protein H
MAGLRSSGAALFDEAGEMRCVQREDGFTLFELLVVLVLVAAAIAVVLPVLTQPKGNARLWPLVTQLALDMRRARAAAITGGRPVAFILDSKARSYRIGETRDAVRLPPDIAIKLALATDHWRVSTGAVITFFPDSSTTGGIVTLSGPASGMSLEVDWLTGDVAARGTPP